jgi:ATP-binding cassette, subfamily B, multidrug efflux pump
MSLLTELATWRERLQKYGQVFWPYRRSLTLGVLALTVTNGLGILIPWQIKEAVDGLQHIFAAPGAGQIALPAVASLDAQWHNFYGHLATIGGLAVLVLGSRIASRLFLLVSGRQMEYDLRNQLYAHFLKMPPAYFSVHPGGELMSRMSSDVDATKMICGGGIMLGVNTLLAYVLTVPFMIATNAPLAGVTFLIYPVVIFGISRIGKKVRAGAYEVQEVLASLSQTAQENLAGMRVIQSYSREAQEASRFEAICDRYLNSYNRLIHHRILMFMTLAILTGLSMAGVLLVGGGQVINHKLEWGGFVAFTLYLEHLAWPTLALGWTLSVFQQGNAALQRIEEVLNTPPAILSKAASQSPEAERLYDATPTTQGNGTKPSPWALELQHLTFAYDNPYEALQQATELSKLASSPSNGMQAENHLAQENTSAKQPVLHDLNLQIRPGETIAIVGPVGSGKSTLLRLLTRLETVPENAIFLNGHDLTALPVDELRQHVVLMPQNSFLFSTTVGRNIAFGLESTTPAMANAPILAGPAAPNLQISEVAEAAGVHLDILNLPKQYDTLVGERGMMLSGGQRQRVALARTLLMDAELLILDDPFSNVDADTERRIVEALQERQLFEGRTTLITTHRFSLITLCDRVVLMDAGRIVAIGTSQELMETQPLYQRLHNLQSLRETLDVWEMKTSEAIAKMNDSDSNDGQEGDN